MNMNAGGQRIDRTRAALIRTWCVRMIEPPFAAAIVPLPSALQRRVSNSTKDAAFRARVRLPGNIAVGGYNEHERTDVLERRFTRGCASGVYNARFASTRLMRGTTSRWVSALWVLSLLDSPFSI